jgi:DNA-binding XRE family transcriptional regulator
MAIVDREVDWANVVRKRRLSLGWSQATLAKAAGVSRQWIVNFESGRQTGAAKLTVVITLLVTLRIDVYLTSEAN